MNVILMGVEVAEQKGKTNTALFVLQKDFQCRNWYSGTIMCCSGEKIGQRQMVGSLQSSVCYRSLTLC